MIAKKSNTGHMILMALCEKPIEVLMKKASMTKRMVNKIISTVLFYCKNRLEDPLIEVLHDVFTNRYVLRGVAERKFSDMICSMLMSPKGRRKIFLRFIGAGSKLGTRSYFKQSFKVFISAYDFMLNAKVGINVHTDDHLDSTLLPAARAIECVKEN